MLVLLSVGEEMAAELVKKMNTREIRRLSAAIGQMPKIEPEDVVGAMEEFLELSGQTTSAVGNSRMWMKSVVEKALGSVKAQQLLQGLKMEQKTLELLWEIDPNSLANLIRKEHPQTQALILAYLDPTKAAQVLPLLPLAEQTDVMLRIARLDSIHPDILQEVEDGLMEEVQMMGTLTASEAGGVDMVVEMLNVMEKKTEKRIQLHGNSRHSFLKHHFPAVLFNCCGFRNIRFDCLYLCLAHWDKFARLQNFSRCIIF